MFIEVMGYLHVNKRLEANQMHFKTLCFVYKQRQTGLFNYIELHCILFYDGNHIISPLDRPITAEFTKGCSMKTSLINIICL